MSKKLAKIGRGIFISAVVVIALLLLATLFPIKNNYQIRIVQSGSMEPAIRTGSVVVVKPVVSYKIGDAVTFKGADKKQTPTTHRIVESRALSGELFFKTKGDANEEADIREIRQSDIIGKVFFSIPFVGYVIDMARKPVGFVILIVIPALIVVYDEVYNILREIGKIRKSKQSKESLPDSESAENGDNQKNN